MKRQSIWSAIRKFHRPIIISLILIFGTTGCWNRRELPNLAIVVGVGLDKVEDQKVADKLEITAQIVRTSGMLTQEKGGGGNTEAFWNAKNTGNSIFETMRDFTHQTSRKLYFPHNQVIIFGRELAKDGIQEYLDFFVRDQETRFGVWVLVADDKASDILDVKPNLEKIPAINLEHMLEAQKATSQTTAVKLNEFMNRILSKTTAPIAAIVKISGQGSERKLIVTGTAVFKDNKLIGELNETETRGLLWVINEVKSGIITVECPESDGNVELEIIRAKSKVTPEISEDKVNFKVEIEEESNIGSQACPDNLEAPEAIEKLEKSQNAAIESEVRAALSKARKLNADIFGFGDILHQKLPSQWKEQVNNWDEVFPALEVELSVDGKVSRPGLSKKTATPKKE